MTSVWLQIVALSTQQVQSYSGRYRYDYSYTRHASRRIFNDTVAANYSIGERGTGSALSYLTHLVSHSVDCSACSGHRITSAYITSAYSALNLVALILCKWYVLASIQRSIVFNLPSSADPGSTFSFSAREEIPRLASLLELRESMLFSFSDSAVRMLTRPHSTLLLQACTALLSRCISAARACSHIAALC